MKFLQATVAGHSLNIHEGLTVTTHKLWSGDGGGAVELAVVQQLSPIVLTTKAARSNNDF